MLAAYPDRPLILVEPKVLDIVVTYRNRVKDHLGKTLPLRRPIALLARSLFPPDRVVKVDSPQPIRRAARTTSASIEHMGVDHRRSGILVHEKLESSAPPTGE